MRGRTARFLQFYVQGGLGDGGAGLGDGGALTGNVGNTAQIPKSFNPEPWAKDAKIPVDSDRASTPRIPRYWPYRMRLVILSGSPPNS